jgi:hypothetical protein
VRTSALKEATPDYYDDINLINVKLRVLKNLDFMRTGPKRYNKIKTKKPVNR